MTRIRSYIDWNLCAALGCSFLLAYGSLLPFQFRDQTLVGAVWEFVSRLQFDVRHQIIGDVYVNFLIYLPLGFFWMKYFRRWYQSARALLLVGGISLLFSILLEFAQAWQSARIASGFDALVNSKGAFMGALLFLVLLDGWEAFRRAAVSRRVGGEALKLLGGRAWRIWACLYGALLVKLLLDPFHIQFQFELLGPTVESLFSLPFLDLQERSYGMAVWNMLHKLALCTPLGAAIAFSIFSEERTKHELRQYLLEVALLVVLGAFWVEFLQGFIATRYTSSSDVVLYCGSTLLAAAATSKCLLGIGCRVRIAPQRAKVLRLHAMTA